MKKVCILGAGIMGANHARIVSQSSHSNLIAVVDPDAIRGQKISIEHHCKWFPSIDDYSDFDYLILATPTEVHFTEAVRALEQGIPILLEKPISSDLLETKLLLDLSARKEILFMCGLVERFNPAILTVQEIVEDLIGIYSVRHSPMISRITTDIDGDLLIHDLDIAMRFMKSSPSELYANKFIRQTKSNEIIEAMDVVATFPDRRFANISVSRIGQKKIRTMNFVETDRLVEVDLLRRDVTIFKNVSEGAFENGAGYKQQTVIEIPTLVTHKEPLASQLDYFVGALDEQNMSVFHMERAGLLELHTVLDDLRAK